MAVMPHPIALGADLSPEKIFPDNSPASSSTDHISASISPAPSTGVPAAASTLPPTPPPLRNGTIIKGHRRSLSRLQSASGYKMKEKSQPTEGKWVFIVNGTKLKKWEQVAPKLLKQLSLVQVRVYATKYPGHGRRLAERAARNGADLVGAIGGDGTLNEVVDGVMRAGVLGPDGLPQAVVTILPLGTASDFHRSMAWDPNNFEEAMWRIGKRGNTAILDVARVRCASQEGTQDRHFINVASCGASARAALKLDSWRWMGQKTAYTMAGLGSLIKYVPRSLAVRVDGGDWVKHSKTSLLAVGNGSYFGNGLNICPDANPYDGQLQVVVGKKMTITDYLFKRHRLKMGKHLKMKEFTADSGMRIDVAVWDNKRQGPKLTESAYDVFEPQTNQNFEAGGGGSAGAAAGTAQQHPSLFRRESSQNFSLVQMTPNGSYTTLERPDNLGAREEGFSTDLGIAGGAPDRPAAREWSGSERSGRSGRSASTISSWQRSASNQDLRNASMSRRSGNTGSRQQQQQPLKLADYGAVPLEIDGEVIGHAPFSIEVRPSAIKFRV